MYGVRVIRYPPTPSHIALVTVVSAPKGVLMPPFGAVTVQTLVW